MTQHTLEPIAIIGMSCRAAGIETLADLWEVVAGAQRRFTAVPPGRWHGMDPTGWPDPPRASLIDRPDRFDARFFGISPRMAAWMDPQHRMMLELAWHAVENAAIAPEALRDEPVAVFAGAFLTDYRERMSAVGRSDAAAFPGTLASFLANRVSYQFGWTGPSTVVDSACSSGLTALGLAVQGVPDGSRGCHQPDQLRSLHEQRPAQRSAVRLRCLGAVRARQGRLPPRRGWRVRAAAPAGRRARRRGPGARGHPGRGQRAQRARRRAHRNRCRLTGPAAAPYRSTCRLPGS
ncbi:hypothetical protein GCM10022402_38070 [Salinactinospora qingdaonensis]|uniref:Ketosynthase family 3 (KS3) domain-containing protein n=1 Tax=Salinactinospora qingdaonensis TaxID=702744 RepID=A0ABP7G562_9ACTN